MDAALVTVGEELLAGETENTNATWLARQLTERGVVVRRVLTVPDEEAVIAEHVRAYAEQFDAVVVTGGLGGTPDDVTMAAVARAFDRDLAVDDLALADVEETLAAFREANPELDIDVDTDREAAIPDGARALLNGAGLSPGCVVENVYVLPGIPEEMRAMFEDVAEEFAGDVRSRSLYTRVPEANLVEPIETANERFDVAVGCYPNRDERYNRLSVRGTDGEELDAAVAWLAEHVETFDPGEAGDGEREDPN